MRFFLVFDHYYSGIIQSQVLDVVELLEGEFEAQIKLIVFLNIRRYKKERKKYLRASSKVWVLPNFGFSRWQWSFPFLALLALVYRPSHVVGRSVFAFQLGQLLKSFKLTKSVGLDARGAEYAEWKEYFFKRDEGPLRHSEIKDLERSAVLQSSIRLAVSNSLVSYWNDELDIQLQLNGNTVVVPSTLSNSSAASTTMTREELNIPTDASVYVFSGSRSDWHGFSQLLHTCERIKHLNPRAHFLFMTNGHIQFSENSKVKHSYVQCWVKPEQVEAHLAMGDYGLLLRSPSLTNKVSSPVKYAEYLRAGLHVLVSPQIGDLSAFTVNNGCGYILDENWEKLNLKFTKRTEQERIHARSLAEEYFSKRAHVKSYGALFNLQPSNPSI